MTHAITDCSLSAEFFYWDENKTDWLTLIGSIYDGDPFVSLSTSTGDIDLATKDEAGHNLIPYTKFTIRVEYTANDVKTLYSKRTVADVFDIIF